MILDRNGRPLNAPAPKLALPVGRVNPELTSRRRTKNGKPVIRVTANMRGIDFHRLKDGVEQSYTPVGQNVMDEGMFQLRVYNSPTAALTPKDKDKR